MINEAKNDVQEPNVPAGTADQTGIEHAAETAILNPNEEVADIPGVETPHEMKEAKEAARAIQNAGENAQTLGEIAHPNTESIGIVKLPEERQPSTLDAINPNGNASFWGKIAKIVGELRRGSRIKQGGLKDAI